MRTFFSDADYLLYLKLLSLKSQEHRVGIWAYCLMPNHVHLVAVPESTSLGRALGEAHHEYAQRVNFREGWRGHLWQERFFSAPMDEDHVRWAVRYILLNPVRAGLVKRPGDWKYSSFSAHFGKGNRFSLVDVGGMEERVSDWDAFLAELPSEGEYEVLRKNTRTGRPLGNPSFVRRVEQTVGRIVTPRKRGPRPRNGAIPQSSSGGSQRGFGPFERGD